MVRKSIRCALTYILEEKPLDHFAVLERVAEAELVLRVIVIHKP